MKILRTLRKQFAIVGIFSSSNSSTKRLPLNYRLLLGFFLFGCTIASQCVYIWVANDLIDCVECICSLSAGCIIFVCFAAIVFRKSELFETIDNMEKLIDTRCKNRKSRRFFLKINRQVDRLSEFVFMVIVKIALQCLILPKCIISFGTYFFINAGNDSFLLPYPLWLPFDWKHPIGYLVAMIITYIIVCYAYIVIACTVTLGIGAFCYVISATKEIQRILNSINHNAHPNENHVNELKILFSEYIHAHRVAKQVEKSFSDILQPIFMSFFTWSLFTMSIALLVIQMAILHYGNVMPLLPDTTLNGGFGVILVFIACELGQRISDAFDKIDLKIEQFDWYLFPIEIKRMLPIFIVIAQQPVAVACFGSIACTRDVFKNVIHRAYSYFTVFRQFSD